MKPLSKAFYFGMIIAGFVLTIPPVLFLLAVYAEGRGRDREVIPFLMLPAMLPFVICMSVSLGILLYKMWTVIQDGPHRTTPGLAVGLLFVPCFNLFWVFQAYWGWTKDFNRYVAEKGISARRMPEGMTLAICILMILAGIPLIGGCFGLVNLVLFLIFINAAIDGVNAVIAAKNAVALR